MSELNRVQFLQEVDTRRVFLTSKRFNLDVVTFERILARTLDHSILSINGTVMFQENLASVFDSSALLVC